MKNSNKEPLFHIVKRDVLPWYKSWGIRAIAIVAALIVCGIITTVTTGLNPLKVYGAFIQGAFGSGRKVWITIQNMSILLIISLALTPAFKMRFWNIGGEGQVLVGALATAACMITLGDKLPNVLLIIVMSISALAAGAVWGLIPAIFKAKWNTNETLSTLMMNYIATQIVAFFTIVWEVPKGSFTVGIINQTTNAVVTPLNPTWRMDVMKKSDWSVLKTASTNSIQVTTLETDTEGQENDVEVTAEVSWSD